jgi:hypothetical protein
MVSPDRTGCRGNGLPSGEKATLESLLVTEVRVQRLGGGDVPP